jgi:hypothetical protein
MAKITGRVEVLVNNEILLNKAGAVASGIGVSGQPNFEREAMVGDTGIHGYIEKPVMARCEVTVTDRDDIMLTDFASIPIGGATVIFRSVGGGKVYTMAEATCLGNFSLTAGEGEVPLIFEGGNWTETQSDT